MSAVTRRSYAGAAPACTLTNSITAGDTTALLTGTVTAWNDTAGGPFFMVIDPGLVTEEKVLVGSRTGSSLSSITRGVDGTTAASHSAGATCYPVFTATDANDANEFTSTMTTRGDLLTINSSVNPARIAIGASGTVLKSDGTDASWATIVAANIASNAVETAKINDNAVTQAKLADRVVGSAELDNLTLNAQTGTTYTLVLADAHKLVTQSNASAITTTIPPNSSVAFEIGDQVNLMQLGAGAITITAGSGVTLRSAGSLVITNGQYSVATCVKIATDEWVLIGNLA